MKNHVAFKFLAILVCALTLAAALASGLGMVWLVKLGDEELDLAQEIQDSKENTLRRAAYDLTSVYASVYLGGCPEALAHGHYGYPDLDSGLVTGKWGYAIQDGTGKTLEAMNLPDGESWERYTLSRLPNSYLVLEGELQNTDRVDYLSHNAYISNRDPEEPDKYTIGFWDYDLGRYREADVGMVGMPEDYSVTIYYADEAFQEAALWDAALWAWDMRGYLPLILVGSLLIFAVGAVYLCCAAGRDPEREGLKPGGFNLIPLDLYAGGCGLAILFLGTVASWAASRGSVEAVVWVLALLAVAACLIFVSFCFACAAQFKMGLGWWLRRTVVGFSAILAWLAVKAAFGLLGEGLKLVPRFCRWLGRMAGKLWEVAAYLVKGLWQLAGRVMKAVGRCLAGAAGWLWEGFHRFLSLVPLTWQWLLVGAGLWLLMLFTATRRDAELVLLGLVLTAAVIGYGANAFGILLEAADKMSKGDLESKVENPLLVGAFKDFAGKLNALAGVAKVAAEKQMKSERMKTELITNVSHDIKTPLTSIISYVDLLQRAENPQQEQEYLEVLGRKSQQLKKLIEDLMEMSKASTGNMAVELGPVDAAEAITQALGEFSDKLEAARLTPMFTPGAPARMLADGRLTWRVLNNLLGNACKYALPGTRLYVDLQQLGGKVVISLKNISREELNVSAEELMERFVRGDAARNTEGSGLGLNIAKSLMEVQGGSLALLVDGDLFKVTLTFPGVE